jgi:hypothetical protein
MTPPTRAPTQKPALVDHVPGPVRSRKLLRRAREQRQQGGLCRLGRGPGDALQSGEHEHQPERRADADRDGDQPEGQAADQRRGQQQVATRAPVGEQARERGGQAAGSIRANTTRPTPEAPAARTR